MVSHKRLEATMNAQTDYLAFIREQLHLRRGEWRSISERSGVPYFTISKISMGTTKDPRWKTVHALASTLSEHVEAA